MCLCGLGSCMWAQRSGRPGECIRFLRAGITGSYELPHMGVTGSGNLTQVICRSSTLFEPLSRLSSPRSSFFKSGCFWRLLPPLSFRALRFVSTKQKKQEKSLPCVQWISLRLAKDPNFFLQPLLPNGDDCGLVWSLHKVGMYWNITLYYTHTVNPKDSRRERPTSHHHGQIN